MEGDRSHEKFWTPDRVQSGAWDTGLRDPRRGPTAEHGRALPLSGEIVTSTGGPFTDNQGQQALAPLTATRLPARRAHRPMSRPGVSPERRA